MTDVEETFDLECRAIVLDPSFDNRDAVWVDQLQEVASQEAGACRSA